MRCSLWEKEGDFTDYFSPLSKKKDLFNKWNREYLFIRPTTRDDAVGSKKSLLWIFILALKPSERLLTREILSAFQKGLVNWSAWSHLINNNQRCQRWAISFRLERRFPPTIHPILRSLTASTSSLADICASFPHRDYSCMATLVN